jgi:hypothetical protein
MRFSALTWLVERQYAGRGLIAGLHLGGCRVANT